MNIVQSVLNSIEEIPAGQIFDYQALADYAQSPNAVIKAVNRLVSKKQLERLSKGKFYRPQKGLLGNRRPSDSELIRSMLYKDGRIRGYITGLSLYNQLGLTTQIPKTITVALNGGRQQKEFGTISIKTNVSRVPIQEDNIRLLQYLDALKDIKNILGSDINTSLKMMCRYISELVPSERSILLSLAMQYYTPQVRALLGMLLSSLNLPVPKDLALSLNPTTIYKLNLDENKWPLARKWNIR